MWGIFKIICRYQCPPSTQLLNSHQKCSDSRGKLEVYFWEAGACRKAYLQSEENLSCSSLQLLTYHDQNRIQIWKARGPTMIFNYSNLGDLNPPLFFLYLTKSKVIVVVWIKLNYFEFSHSLNGFPPWTAIKNHCPLWLVMVLQRDLSFFFFLIINQSFLQITSKQ